MSKETESEVAVMRTLGDMIDQGVEFDVELWDDLARKDIDHLDDEARQDVEEAVASILYYMGLATCTVATEPSDDDYRRLRECCAQAWAARNVIREAVLKAGGVDCEEWRDHGPKDTEEVPDDVVLH